jgi:hypothetical protein
MLQGKFSTGRSVTGTYHHGTTYRAGYYGGEKGFFLGGGRVQEKVSGMEREILQEEKERVLE